MSDRADNFTRADSSTTLGTPSDSGSAWNAEGFTWGIYANHGALQVSAGQAICSLESSSANVELQASIYGPGFTSPGGDAGLCGRVADSNNYIVLTYNQDAAGMMSLYKVVSGGFTQLATIAAGTPLAGDVMKLRIDSSNQITGYINGVQKVTANDATGATNTRHGLRSNASLINYFAALTIIDLTVTPPPPATFVTVQIRAA